MEFFSPPAFEDEEIIFEKPADPFEVEGAPVLDEETASTIGAAQNSPLDELKMKTIEIMQQNGMTILPSEERGAPFRSKSQEEDWRHIPFVDLRVSDEVVLKGVFSFTFTAVNLSLRYELPPDQQPKTNSALMELVEMVRKRNQGTKLGGIMYNFETNSIDVELRHQFINKFLALSYDDFESLTKMFFATGFYFFKNNLLMLSAWAEPEQLFRFEFAPSAMPFEGLSTLAEPETEMMRTFLPQIQKIKQNIENMNNGKGHPVVEELASFEPADGKPVYVGRGGFSEAYSQPFHCQIRDKKEKRILKLVFKKPRVKDNKTPAPAAKEEPLPVENSGIDGENAKGIKMNKRSKKIAKENNAPQKKEETYLKKKTDNEVHIIKKVLSQIESKNIVKHYIAKEKYQDNDIFQERCSYSDLYTYITNTKDISFTNKLIIASGICEGLEALHKAEIVHKDIKPNNIFIAAGVTPKIGDFGESWYMGRKDKFIPCGSTPYYDPPEVREHRDKPHYSKAIDFYALGLTLAELFFNITPKTIAYTKEMKKEQQKWLILTAINKLISEERGILGKIYYPKIKDILEGCMQEDIERRFTVSEVKTRVQYILAHHQAVLTFKNAL